MTMVIIEECRRMMIIREIPAKRKKRHTVGKIIAMIQAILSLLVLAVLFILNVLPMMYLAAIAIVLAFALVFCVLLTVYAKESYTGQDRVGYYQYCAYFLQLLFADYTKYAGADHEPWLHGR